MHYTDLRILGLGMLLLKIHLKISSGLLSPGPFRGDKGAVKRVREHSSISAALNT